MRDNPAVNAMVTSLTTLGRTGVPSDIGPLIAALLSDETRWINARRIDVSGGMRLSLRPLELFFAHESCHTAWNNPALRWGTKKERLCRSRSSPAGTKGSAARPPAA